MATRPDGYLAVTEKQIRIIITALFEHQFLERLRLLILARHGHFHIGIVILYGNECIGGIFGRAVLIILNHLHFNIELRSTGVVLVELCQLAAVHSNGGLGGLSLAALAAAFAAAFAAADAGQNDLARVRQGGGVAAAVAAGAATAASGQHGNCHRSGQQTGCGFFI